MAITTVIVYLTLISLLFTIGEVIKLKKENKKLKEEIRIMKKCISNQ